MSDTRIRLLREEDWDEVVALEERAYAASGLSEGEEALRSRHRASPSTCFVLEHAGGFAGYLLALPYPLFRCPDLSLAEGGTVRENRKGSNLHLHDLVIAERARGRGLARRMQRHLEETGWSARYRTLSLVAVHGSQRMWTLLGYRTRPEIGLPASYGAEAVYMAKPLERAVTGPAPGCPAQVADAKGAPRATGCAGLPVGPTRN
ncbi:GNAT family N-acetyltransferase [Kitasatospora sp. NBC_00374]|uniref:GNAT family N-acetyltransferase n=1 Tax=Kitasatospora sp. NBC_00374 TaxID=2975964 RepID=UPI0030E20314